MTTPELEAGKRYPVFVEHYGGPTAQEVTREWMKPFAQYLVSKGWIYFQIDNRGSANRGRAFEDQIYHAMGTVEVEDQMLRSEEHTSELQTLMRISYAVFCLKTNRNQD